MLLVGILILEFLHEIASALVLSAANVVEDFEGMVEVVFMCTALACLHIVEHGELRKNQREQTRTVQVYESTAGLVGKDDLVEFLLDTLSADDFQPFSVARQCVEGLVFDVELQLCGESHTAHHAQRVVGEGNIRVEGRADNAVLQVSESVERIDKLTKTVSVEADGQRVDGEVAPVLVVL